MVRQRDSHFFLKEGLFCCPYFLHRAGTYTWEEVTYFPFIFCFKCLMSALGSSAPHAANHMTLWLLDIILTFEPVTPKFCIALTQSILNMNWPLLKSQNWVMIKCFRTMFFENFWLFICKPLILKLEDNNHSYYLAA